MTPHDEDLLGPGEDRVRAALLALPVIDAEPAFRARLRSQFTQGAFESQAGGVGRISPLPRSEWIGAALAVAACLVLAFLVLDRGPDWQVTRTGGQGSVLVGNRMVPLSDVATLSAALARGGRIRLPASGTLELVAPGSIAMSLAEGSEVVIPRAPGRWFGRSVRAEVRNGEAFITTGRRFSGSHLTVTTDEATVEVVGTTFAVLRHPEGTCVCVMDGRVRVSPAGESVIEVGAGLRRFCYPRGSARTSESAPILGYSEKVLHQLRDSTERLLER